MSLPARTTIIDVTEARIKTLQVEIAALTVSGKQMTLATFRQLEESFIWRDPERDNFDLRGTPWGRVNYFWKESEGSLHIVWQSGRQLFRSLHTRPYRQAPGAHELSVRLLQWGRFSYVSSPETRENIAKWQYELDAINARADSRIALWKAAYSNLEALPQLFIAV